MEGDSLEALFFDKNVAEGDPFEDGFPSQFSSASIYAIPEYFGKESGPRPAKLALSRYSVQVGCSGIVALRELQRVLDDRQFCYVPLSPFALEVCAVVDSCEVEFLAEVFANKQQAGALLELSRLSGCCMRFHRVRSLLLHDLTECGIIEGDDFLSAPLSPLASPAFGVDDEVPQASKECQSECLARLIEEASCEFVDSALDALQVLAQVSTDYESCHKLLESGVLHSLQVQLVRGNTCSRIFRCTLTIMGNICSSSQEACRHVAGSDVFVAALVDGCQADNDTRPVSLSMRVVAALARANGSLPPELATITNNLCFSKDAAVRMYADAAIASS